ncbi:MAG: flagellar hook-associated protein FlgK [Planctomycetota bacterium]|jgi:flagellar hook-associated protein 1 FlgK
MDSFGIGISGLNAAQKAFEIIGNNIANAATDGFHRQRINLSPAYAAQVGSVLLGGGVDLASITRTIDGLLQKEMFKQASSMEQISKELTTLRMVESAFGELSGRTGLSTTIDEFFNAMQDLSAHPAEAIWQNQAVTAAETMAGQFRTMGDFLTSLDTQIRLEAENAIEEVNALVSRIADLNDSIKRHEIGGGQANNLRDQRDQCITELAKLISVETQSREHGVVDVSVSGIPVVTSTSAFALEVGLTETLGLGIGVAGESNYTINVQGGRLGALVTLKNDSLADIRTDLDSLAGAIVRQINEYHVQGVGSEGSFTGLVGWPMSSETLADFDPPVSNGNIYVESHEHQHRSDHEDGCACRCLHGYVDHHRHGADGDYGADRLGI